MKSIVLIIPYFGKLPSYFPAWKASALNNPTVDFLFFTDIDELQDEQNIKTQHLSFEDFKLLIQNKFDFPICLEKPYKLCDYKPTYGYVLQDYIKGYDFWGHCDIDLIFGDIRHFITDEILKNHRKILEHGHFTLYHNDEDTNTVFMRCPGYGDYDYKKAFSSDESMYFDEFLGTMLIFRKERISTYYNTEAVFQVDSQVKSFQCAAEKKYNIIFEYYKGKLYYITGSAEKSQKKEIMYAHFLKRNINCTGFRGGKSFYVVPNKIVETEHHALHNKMFTCRGNAFYRIQKKLEHCSDYIARYRRTNGKSFFEFRKERKHFRYELGDAKKTIRELTKE